MATGVITTGKQIAPLYGDIQSKPIEFRGHPNVESRTILSEAST